MFYWKKKCSVKTEQKKNNMLSITLSMKILLRMKFFKKLLNFYAKEF
jgi:hypothetical protein